MPPPDPLLLGPLAGLIGTWEGDQGGDAACSRSYQITMTIGNGTWSYDETTVVDLARHENDFSHTDRNTLHRVDD